MSILKDAFGFLVGWLIDVPEQEYRGTELTKAATDDYIKKVYGTVRQQAGTIIFKRTNDADNDKIKNDLLHIVIVWAEECASVSECYIDDIPASSNNAIFFAKKNKRVVYAVNFPNGMDGYTSAQLNAAGWTNTDKCEGKACTYVVLEAHKGDNAITSEPSLKADLVGTTTSNPAAILKDYLKDPINGKGLDDTYLNLPAFSSVEAFCDSQVETYTGSGVYRNLFTCNIALDTSQTILQNTNDILRTFRGLLPILDGKLTPIVEKDDPVVSLEITEEDIDELGPIRNSSKKDRYNQVIVTYYDAEADGTAQEAVYPEVDSATDIAWLAADNGFRQERTVDLKGCNNYYEALAFAKILAEISREQLSTTITIKGIWATLFEVGDIVNVSHSYPGWEQKPFRITNTTEKMDEVELTLREHQPYIYDYFGEGNKPEIPDTSIDDSPPAVPADLTITHSYDNFKQVRVSWVSDAARFDYQVIDENDNVLEADRTALNYVDLKGYSLGTYTFRVAAIGGLSRSSGWAEITITLQAPGVPSSLTVNASNFTLECIANLLGADSATQFEYALTPANQTEDPTDIRGPAAAYTFQGLAPNTQYKVWARSHNALGTSGWIYQLATTTNNAQEIIEFIGMDVLQVDVGQLQIDYTAQKDSLDQLILDVSDFEVEYADFKTHANSIFQQQLVTTYQLQAQLVEEISSAAAYREELTRRVEAGEELTNALIYVDPVNGSIVNRAYNYTDDAFTQAGLLIDGVSGSVTALSERVELTETDIVSLSSELALIPGQITATANSVVSEAISALEPAHSFNFFDSAQGWVAVSGTLTPATNQIDVTYGDIENGALSYTAEDNRVIRINLERTAGTGWTGDVIIERDNATTQTFSGIIDEPGTGETVLIVSFAGLTDYSDTINRVRLTLGASTADEFTIKSISIGKLDAVTQDLQNITARVTQAELDINASEAEISNRVTTTYYNGNTVTFSNVETTVNGLDSIIALEATRQELIDNDVVTKAVTAATFINGETGTITDIVQSLDNDIAANTQTITDVQTEVDAQSGTITQQSASLSSEKILSYEAAAQLLEEIAISGVRKLQDLDNQASLALAISQLQIDVTPISSLVSDVETLQASTITNQGQINATNNALSQVQTDVEGNASAIEQVTLDVSALDQSLSGAIGRIDTVEITANNTVSALSALELTVSGIGNELDAAETLLTATIARVDQVEIDSGDNAAAISGLLLRVGQAETGLTGALERIDQVEIDSDNNAIAISAVQLSVSGLQSSLNNTDAAVTAVVSRVDQVEIDSGDNATAISVLEGVTQHPQSGNSALYNFVQQAQSTADGAQISVTNITNTVNDQNTGLSATNQLAQQAKTTADGAVSSITSVSARIDGVDADASAALTLANQLDENLDLYRSTAQLAVANDGSVSLIQLDATPNFSGIKFQTDQFELVDQNGSQKVYWDAAQGRFTFNGHLVAVTGTVGSLTTESAGFIRTAAPEASGTRVVVNGPGSPSDFSIWVGEGPQTEANASFFVKKNGIGFIKGDFFQGEIIESKFASASSSNTPVTATINNHNSSGKVVEITGVYNVNLVMNGDTENVPLNMDIVLKRGSTVIESISNGVRGISILGNETHYNLTGTFVAFDNLSTEGDRQYSITLSFTGSPSGTASASTNKVSIKTFENKLA